MKKIRTPMHVTMFLDGQAVDHVNVTKKVENGTVIRVLSGPAKRNFGDVKNGVMPSARKRK